MSRRKPDISQGSVLIAEDDESFALATRRYLRLIGYRVVLLGDGEETLRCLLETDHRFDALVLDLLLPRIDGREICRRLRAAGCWIPVVMTTALGELEDRLDGFGCGADDYLVKPFSLEELTLRLRAVVRRGNLQSGALQAGDLRLDLVTRQSWRGETELKLTHRESQILEFFLKREGLVVTRGTIGKAVWSEKEEVSENLVDQYIAHLRRKIDRPFGRRDIETIHRVGYRLSASGS